MNYTGTGRLGKVFSVSYTSAAAQSTTIGSQTYKIRTIATTDAYISMSSTSPSSTTATFVPANTPEYFTVTPGQTVTAIQSASNGVLNVTEIS